MKIKEAVAALARVAPLPLQESYDNAGLQVGLTEERVSGALLCLDVTEAVVAEAVARGCNLIVSHHPLIFHKLARISDENYIGRTLISAVKNGVAVVSMHTNIDAAIGGVNCKIAEKIGLGDIAFIGEKKVVDGIEAGSGVIGALPEALAASDFLTMLKKRFAADNIAVNELLCRPISRVAICGGAGAFLLDEAVNNGADAFITGEMRYNDFFAREQTIQIAAIGHYQSELCITEVFRDILEGQGVTCFITTINTNPIKFF
ncbi:MAG: Nif3-like dinuclear metal center hexameric protein [Prevotella sp.]|nr:Nif3-like dinuclear metal center hexameric protein [Prevotella sp.]